MKLNLNQDHVQRCNDNSIMGTRGDGIVRDAMAAFDAFDCQFEDTGDLTSQQIAVINERRESYKTFVEQIYNKILSVESGMVSWMVAGPANYDHGNFNKQQDSVMKMRFEGTAKMNRFIENTKKRIKDLEPLDVTIEKISNGQWGFNQPISSDDPHVIEKLEAKVDYMRTLQERMKAENRAAKKVGKSCVYPSFALQNNLQNLHATEKRIRILKSNKAAEYEDVQIRDVLIRVDKDDNRVRIIFDDKPDQAVRDRLKSNGFRWSPKNMAWQRQLTQAAMNAAKMIVETL